MSCGTGLKDVVPGRKMSCVEKLGPAQNVTELPQGYKDLEKIIYIERRKSDSLNYNNSYH